MEEFFSKWIDGRIKRVVQTSGNYAQGKTSELQPHESIMILKRADVYGFDNVLIIEFDKVN